MSIKKVRYKLWDGSDMIISLIKRWEPGSLHSEKEYENSLYHFLCSKLEDFKITPQFSRDRFKADIVIEDEIIIELKNNLSATRNYHALIGQLTEYKKWDGVTIVILLGETDRDLRLRLEQFIEQEQNEYSFFMDSNFQIIHK
jgi:hypothetical protein